MIRKNSPNKKAAARSGAYGLTQSKHRFSDSCRDYKPRSVGVQATAHHVPSSRPNHWRNHIADLGSYYRQLFPNAKPNKGGHALVRCCFHEDGNPSLSICFDHGGWRCFADCGSGDLVSFVMKREGCNFQTALEILGAR